jgi:hypothetical protein
MSLCRYLLTITQAKIQLMSHEVGYGTSQDELFTLEPQFLQYLEVVFFSSNTHECCTFVLKTGETGPLQATTLTHLGEQRGCGTE